MHSSFTTKDGGKGNLLCVCGSERERVTLKMRSLSSETRASPPLKWTAQMSTRDMMVTPIALMIRTTGNLTTGTPMADQSHTARETEREYSLGLWGGGGRVSRQKGFAGRGIGEVKSFTASLRKGLLEEGRRGLSALKKRTESENCLKLHAVCLLPLLTGRPREDKS